MRFKPTKAQQHALKLIKSGAKHVLIFGGSRSGKTTLLVMVIIFRSLAYPGSRHLICRLKLKDAKSSVLHETLMPWLERTMGEGLFKYYRHENFIKLSNGSEIWIGGLGDREQVERILGHEYNTIYFNEVSQLSYYAVTTAYSRLAMKIPGCRNLFLYDCNPASPLHWAYRVFVRKINFRVDEPLSKPELYVSMLMNPEDNRENLDDDYIEGILDDLPEKQRNRFRYGKWVKGEGCIYEKFDESMIIDQENLPDMDYYTGGLDFGMNMAAVKVGYHQDLVFIVTDFGGYNVTARSFDEKLQGKGWYEQNFSFYCDPAGGERIQEITNGLKANNAVDSGIDYINSLIERNRFFVASCCQGVLSEIWDYCRDEGDSIIKVNDHFMDAVRYGVFSGVQRGVVIG